MSLHLFDGFGIELEYMIVSAESLSVLPVADQVLVDEHGAPAMSVEHGDIAWSNELALHVIELKTNGPTRALSGVAGRFHQSVRELAGELLPLSAALMPTAMHPWMDPHAELRLWPHDDDAIYRTFDRIFDCTGHGWANLQSMHINLPFCGDTEFARLHAATRLILPILPALAASSPMAEGKLTGLHDTRLQVYASNARKVPSVSGMVIPESVRSPAEYQSNILEAIYADLEPHDPEGVLRHEWVNARGAIARFDRDTIEIRVLDVQECPAADLAIAAAVVSAVKMLCEEQTAPLEAQLRMPMEPLVAMLQRSWRDGDQAMLGEAAGELDYLELLGYRRRCTAAELWAHLVATTLLPQPGSDEWMPALEHILTHGCLARRIVRALGNEHEASRREVQAAVYGRLCVSLLQNQLF